MLTAEDRLLQIEKALESRAGGDPELFTFLIDALEERRHQKRFACYWEPVGDQLQIWDAIRERPNWKVLLALGGNGVGKSQVGKFLTTAWLLGKDYFRDEPCWKWVEPLPIPDPPNNVRGVALINDTLRDPMWEGLTGAAEHPAFFPADMLADKPSNHLFTARFKSGSKFHGKSADTDPKTHGGPNLSLVWLDEECSKGIFDENYQRTRKGGHLIVTATPLDDVGTVAHPWIYDMIEEWRAGNQDIIVVFMSTLNNPFLPEEEKRRQIAKWRGHPEEQARLYGIPTRRSGLYYKQWRSAPPLWVPARDLPRNGFRAVMIDPAVTGTVGALWVYFDPKGRMTLYREYKAKNSTVSCHVEAILNENRGDSINMWLADPFMGRQRVPDAVEREQHKTVLQVWRDAGLPRLQLPQIDLETCWARSHEYMNAAFDETHPHPAMEVFDHLTAFEDEIKRYVIDSVIQGPNRGESRDRPRKGREGSSTLMECFQYLAGMGLRARPTDRPPQAAIPGASNYFDTAGDSPGRLKLPRGFDPEPW